MTLSSKQLENAAKNIRFNIFTQIYSMVILPTITALLITTFTSNNKSLRDGLFALSILPCTINLCVTHTDASGGDVSTAIVNAVIGNLIGVLWCPLAIYYFVFYLNKDNIILTNSNSISLTNTFQKLSKMVFIPMIFGQIIRLFPVQQLLPKIKPYSAVFSQIIM